jgi:hypothetical protein
MTVQWLINTPYHQRWWLPDGKHAYNGNIFGDDLRMAVIEMETMRTKETFVVKLTNPNYKDVEAAFQEKAKKKYPKQLRSKEQEVRDRAFQQGITNLHMRRLR